jgi:hypothetical protein
VTRSISAIVQQDVREENLIREVNPADEMMQDSSDDSSFDDESVSNSNASNRDQESNN